MGCRCRSTASNDLYIDFFIDDGPVGLVIVYRLVLDHNVIVDDVDVFVIL